MNATAKLDLVENLIRMSGLEKKQAQDLLEKNHWNVDSAYRMYKKNQFAQQGLKSTNRYSESMATMSRPVQRGGVVYGRPHTEIIDGFGGMGTVMTGTGSYMNTATHPAFMQPEPVPKFPVEKPVQKERIIPIQIENKPAAKSMPPPTSKKPAMPTKTHYPGPNNGPSSMDSLVNKGDNFPKSQSYPVPNRGDHYGRQQQLREDNATVIKVGLLKGDNFPREKENQPPVGQNPKPPPGQPDMIETPNSTPKLLKRGISKISQNAFLVDEERKLVLNDIAEDCHDNMYIQTFVLPDVTGYTDTFRAFLEKDLIETSTLVALEQAGRLNWWAELGVCQRLLPMATSGDGNCLLHAASLGMWGIHDRQLMLRKALYDTLTNKYYRQALQRRWRWQQTQANKQADLIFSEAEWNNEWDNVLRLASTTPRSIPGSMHKNNSCCDSIVTTHSHCPPIEESESPVVYESLEEFHVFVLAHVIQRPIIVVADTILRDANGDALAPIPFGGIYLPLEITADHCYRSPLLLTYDAAHFSALVPMERTGEDERTAVPVAIPVVCPDLSILPLHFSIDPGQSFNWEKNNATFNMSEENKINLLKRYMDLEKLPIYGSYSDSNSDDKNSTGSYESDDGLIDKSKKKDNKMSQQLHTVSKQFGSFGKSVGKKLKNIGKANKEDKKGRKVSMTQSTKYPLTISALKDSDHQYVWCCKLSLKKCDTHQKMIDNYLLDAKTRYQTDTSSRQLRNDEIISRAQTVNNTSRSEKVPCVTNGCSAYGSADTSYLCSKCYADQKQQLIDQEKDMYKTFASKHHPYPPHHKDDLDTTRVGKSRFYDMTDSKSSTVVQPKLVVDLGSQNKVHNSRNSNPVQSHPRTRTPSPDYDNVDYTPTQNYHPPPSAKPSGKIFENKGISGVRCRNPDCDFFGSKEMDNYCSGCYKAYHKKDMKH